MLGSLSEATTPSRRRGRASAAPMPAKSRTPRLADDRRRARVAEHVRSRRSRREEPLDVHVPEPIVDRADGTDPEHAALLADSVGLASPVVLETLSPAERLAFALHDMFAVPRRDRPTVTAHLRLPASSPAARAAASRARPRFPTPISRPSAKSSTPSSPLRAGATSRLRPTHSTRTSSSGRTAGPFPSTPPEWFAGRPPWPARRSPSRASISRCGRRSSTARPAPSRSGTASRSRLRASHPKPEDRRDGRPRRPRAPQPARPDNSRLTDGGHAVEGRLVPADGRPDAPLRRWSHTPSPAIAPPRSSARLPFRGRT